MRCSARLVRNIIGFEWCVFFRIVLALMINMTRSGFKTSFRKEDSINFMYGVYQKEADISSYQRERVYVYDSNHIRYDSVWNRLNCHWVGLEIKMGGTSNFFEGTFAMERAMQRQR